MQNPLGQIVHCSIGPLAKPLPIPPFGAIPLTSSQCSQFPTDVWTVELCHESHITQFNGTERNPQFSLGVFQKTVLAVKPNLEVISEYYGGSACDSNPKIRRTARVIYYCEPHVHEEFKLTSIDNNSPCNFTFHIHSDVLCEYSALISDRIPQSVYCYMNPDLNFIKDTDSVVVSVQRNEGVTSAIDNNGNPIEVHNQRASIIANAVKAEKKWRHLYKDWI